jgi:UPF0716 protein FxsA
MKMFLLIYFFLEVIITITLGGKIGGLNTFFEIVMSAVVGAVIIMKLRSIVMNSLSSVMSGQMTPEELVKGNLLTLLGAVFLILPGFLSDFIGLVLQLPFVKSLLKRRIVQPNQNRQTYTHKGDDDVIDVEIIEHTTISK